MKKKLSVICLIAFICSCTNQPEDIQPQEQISEIILGEYFKVLEQHYDCEAPIQDSEYVGACPDYGCIKWVFADDGTLNRYIYAERVNDFYKIAEGYFEMKSDSVFNYRKDQSHDWFPVNFSLVQDTLSVFSELELAFRENEQLFFKTCSKKEVFVRSN